jgi:serine protease
VAALVLAREPSLTPAQVLSRLQANALPRTSAQCPQPCGAGLLSAVSPAPPPPPPPGPVSVALTLDNPALETGDSTWARARVTRNGVPVSGHSVGFSSANPGVASVSPASAATDGNGQAVSIVKGESKGDTTVRASANGASDSKPVRVPDLSLIGIAILLAAVGLTHIFRNGVRRSRADQSQCR